MSFLKRLFGIGSANAHAALDKLEDPIKMADQGIRDLKADLNESLKALAEIKAITIRTKRELDGYLETSTSYEQKAVLLLQRAQQGQLTPEEADRLATESLSRKEQADKSADTHRKLLEQNETQVAKMEQNVQKLRSQIEQWENEAKVLKARAKVSDASQKINKQLANIDSSSTIAMLERMKEKVDKQEALAESYGQIASASTSVDDEINKALGSGSSTNSSPALDALKERLRLQGGQ